MVIAMQVPLESFIFFLPICLDVYTGLHGNSVFNFFEGPAYCFPQWLLIPTDSGDLISPYFYQFLLFSSLYSY